MPRFVVLAHDWPTPHWDLLLEQGGVLKAWRLLAEPGHGEVPAEPNHDHRLFYLDYEGPLSDNRGSVTRWDGGEMEWIESGPERIAVKLKGVKLRSRCNILENEGHWSFSSIPEGS